MTIQKSVLAFLLFFLFLPLFSRDSEPETVDSVDLQRYVGMWYEIARIPNRFQKSCAFGSTAEYFLREDGKIEVINRCYKKDGRENKINGIAQVVDTQSKAKLRVSFFSIFGWHLFWGDYWIIGLDKDYRWAIVGSPDRKYGWILCRVPTLSENEREKIFDLLQKRGYEPNQFLPTRHETGNRI